jgi:ubiquitin-activating enzyme E1
VTIKFFKINVFYQSNINNNVHFEINILDCSPINSRYDSQIAVFGKKLNDQILNLRYFLVGAGAIGCEVAKCWAMMGLGAGNIFKINDCCFG